MKILSSIVLSSAILVSGPLHAEGRSDNTDTYPKVIEFAGKGVAKVISGEGETKKYMTTTTITKTSDMTAEVSTSYVFASGKEMKSTYNIQKHPSDNMWAYHYDVMADGAKVGWGYCFKKKKKVCDEQPGNIDGPEGEKCAQDTRELKKAKKKKVCHQTMTIDGNKYEETWMVKKGKLLRTGYMTSEDGKIAYWVDKNKKVEPVVPVEEDEGSEDLDDTEEGSED